MASTLVKAAIGLAGVTTVGGGATFVYLNSDKNKSADQEESKSNEGTKNQDASPSKIEPAQPEANKLISSLFEGTKITLLTDQEGDTATWKTKWKSFKEKYDTLQEKKNWEFNNWNDLKAKEDDESIKLFRQKCTENSKKNVVDDKSQLFLDVKEFCTKSTEQPENK